MSVTDERPPAGARERGTRPVPAVLELDGISLQPMFPSHAGAVVELHSRPWNATAADLPDDIQQMTDMLTALRKQPFVVPMLVVRDSRIIALATTGLANVRHLNAYYIALFDDLEGVDLGLRMHIRHVFWSVPLHRLQLQVPVVSGSERYMEMLERVGFEREGTLKDHVMIGGAPCDIAAFGLLRSDVEQWAGAFEPRLRLTP